MIYVPSDNTYNKCYVVQNEDVIRAYDTIPRNSTSYSYKDYYINSDYIYKEGSGTWSNYTALPTCLSSDIISNDFWYRIDLSSILLNVLIISIFAFYIPIKIFSRLFKRGGL